MKQKVSVVIRCLNEEKHIGRLLQGITEQTYQEVEIIVVDSGSRDRTLEIARSYPTKIIQIKPEDFSFGYALNIGCQAASGDLLLFASAHVYPVYTNWIELMVAPFSDPKVGLVYGQQRGNEVTRYSEHQIFAKWFPEESTKNQLHPFCNNANCAIRRSLWEQQPYDETLTGLEDLAWAKKMLDTDHRIAYQSGATIIHVHEETWKSVFNRYRREAIALRLIMKHETFNFFNFLNLWSKNIVSDFKQAWHDRVFWQKAYEIVLFRTMQFWGTYRGYKQSYLMDNAVRERFYYPKGYIEKEKSSDFNGSKINYSD